MKNFSCLLALLSSTVFAIGCQAQTTAEKSAPVMTDAPQQLEAPPAVEAQFEAQNAFPKLPVGAERKVEPAALKLWNEIRQTHRRTRSLSFVILEQKPVDSDDTEYLQATVEFARPNRWRFQSSANTIWIDGTKSIEKVGKTVRRNTITSFGPEFSIGTAREDVIIGVDGLHTLNALLNEGTNYGPGKLTDSRQLNFTHLRTLGTRRVYGQWCQGLEGATFWQHDGQQGGVVTRFWVGRYDHFIRRIESYDFQSPTNSNRTLTTFCKCARTSRSPPRPSLCPQISSKV